MARLAVVLGGFVAGQSAVMADPGSLVPVVSPRQDPVPLRPDAPARIRSTKDLDGSYLWLAPLAAALHSGGGWDSSAGAAATLVRVREGDGLGALGTSLGATRFAERDAGRLWLDAVVGSRRVVPGVMCGVSAGALVELAALAHPKVGGQIGIWAFAGVTPFARVGVLAHDGVFVEIGVQIALPALRW